jgi:hypothetical protein
MESKQQLIKRARIYDQLERASDHGIGHPGGPTGWRKPRAPPATGNAAKLRRLRKGHPELHARVMEGELTVGKAATMAGFHTPKKPKLERDNNSITRLQEMELWLGRSHRGSLFASEEERRSAWFEHRDRLMGYWGNNGRRPQAWWKFEAPFKYPGFNRERSALWRPISWGQRRRENWSGVGALRSMNHLRLGSHFVATTAGRPICNIWSFVTCPQIWPSGGQRPRLRSRAVR